MKVPHWLMQVFPTGVSQIDMDELGERLRARYEVRGLSHTLWRNDWSLLRRLQVHPALATTADLERVIARAKHQNTRALYASRFRSIYDTLRDLGVCDNPAARDLPKIRKARSVPRPLTDEEAAVLLNRADEPFRHWFMLGCLSGFRAMEVSQFRGDQLEHSQHGWQLRVVGKGGTDLVVPAHPLVVDMVRSYGTSGRLWELVPNKISHRASKEMQRLGVDKTFHQCRHWYATALLKATGGDVAAVQACMRHTNVQTTMMYAKLGEDRPRLAVESLQVPAA